MSNVDCYCDKFPVKPHKHLVTDDKTYDIKPDIKREKAK